MDCWPVVSNIQLGNVVSDTFCKSSIRILDEILENPCNISFDIKPLTHGSIKKTFWIRTHHWRLHLLGTGWKIKGYQTILGGFENSERGS